MPMYICCMEYVEIFKALSNKTRLLILQWLKDPETHFPEQFTHEHVKDMEYVGVCVGQIQQKTGLTQSTVSEYLSVLQRTGLIESTRVGQWTYYKRNENAFQQLKQLIDTEL
jgi:DNA-binding transcriptional ArsR family regulator